MNGNGNLNGNGRDGSGNGHRSGDGAAAETGARTERTGRDRWNPSNHGWVGYEDVREGVAQAGNQELRPRGLTPERARRVARGIRFQKG